MSTPPVPFGRRLREEVAARGRLVAGVDPHAALLASWGLEDGPEGLRAFSRTVLEAVTGQVAAIKPQSAYFERHGSAGVAVLEELLAAARAAGVLTILDVKRGDIGSTMTAYAQAHLLPGAPLEADAITVSPYLGTGSLDPATELARQHGKGLFLLALTSNPDGPQVQHARTARDTPRGSAAPRRGSGRASAWSSARPSATPTAASGWTPPRPRSRSSPPASGPRAPDLRRSPMSSVNVQIGRAHV